MAELKGSESIPTVALSVRPIYYEEVPPMAPLRHSEEDRRSEFRMVEVVRSFQAAKKRELKLFAESLS
jgi:hypothetical protein